VQADGGASQFGALPAGGVRQVRAVWHCAGVMLVRAQPRRAIARARQHVDVTQFALTRCADHALLTLLATLRNAIQLDILPVPCQLRVEQALKRIA
jgi:hypothetical protein